MQLEERRVLMEAERDKVITTIVKEKDVLSRANFKLLQLLELKDKAVKMIVDSL
jgi:23S rRNA U2552 (ribose-2'-O)-methylase RlmE/FtsJ